mgnify:CR=1 FL=1
MYAMERSRGSKVASIEDASADDANRATPAVAKKGGRMEVFNAVAALMGNIRSLASPQ